MRLNTKPRSMRESRSFRKKARLLFNLSTNSTSCREKKVGSSCGEKKGGGEEKTIHYVNLRLCLRYTYQSIIVLNLCYFFTEYLKLWLTWTVPNLKYLVVTTSNISTDGTHKRSDVIHKAVWETLTPRNTHVWSQKQVMRHALCLEENSSR